ncbi:hypothetical protein niasHT_009791 [Heterodera trifolii]|uniref:C2H2-type domain-containing protein n=1 Tax=Heterodera trifolii TaxID=157864 RepID=A0ABD2MDX0_9BILA
MFQHDLGLINHLVVQQQQQRIKKEMAEEQQQQQQSLLNNGQAKCGAVDGAAAAQHRPPQRIPSATSSISSGGHSETELARASPAALINNLLGRNNGNSAQQQQSEQLTMGGRGTNVIGHQIAQHSAAGLNGALLQGIDFAANQLANYAGHFHDQLDMNSLFGTNNIAGVAASPFGVYGTSTGASLHGAAIASTADGSLPVPLSAAGIASHRRQRSSGGNSLKCLYCPKKIVGGQAELQAHLEDCRMVRMHECTQCGKRFKARGGLQQHSKIHINDRPYHCRYCPKRFTQKSHLDQHERIHTGLKPFTCQYCGRQFRQRSQQLGHEATHMNRERHSMGGMTMSAAVLGGLVGAAGGYGDAALCGRERTTHLALKQPQQQQQEMAQAAAAQLTADEQRRQQQQQQSSSPTRPLGLGRPTAAGGVAGNGTRHFHRPQQQQMHQQQTNMDQCCAGDNTSPMAHAQQQHQMNQMNSFNGLLRAVQSNDSAAVDGLLGLRGSMAMKQQQQQHVHSGMELNEQLQLVSAQLMNR